MKIKEKNYKRGRFEKQESVFILVAVILLVVIFSVFFFIHSVNKEKDRYIYLAESKAEHTASLVDRITATRRFLRTPRRIYRAVQTDTGVSLKNVGLAPGGVISDVYPLDGNEELIGFDLFDLSHEGGAEATEARDKGKTVFTNPFELVQGGVGMAGRAPVFLIGENGREFWGLVTVTIDFDNFIKELRLDDLKELGADYELSYIDNNGEAHVMTSYGNIRSDAVKKNFKVREVAQGYNHPGDLNRFLSAFTKENVMSKVKKNGIFTLGYRLMLNGKPVHVQMKAAMVTEKEGPRLVVGLNDIDNQVRQEEEFERRIADAQTLANIDAMTGVKNRHAFLEAETNIDRKIADRRQPPFAIVFLDVNDLKKINDTKGHQAGDQYLRDACAIICGVFSHSPVFRIGGDEFAVISQGSDYERINDLVGRISDHNAEAAKDGGVIVACGMARYENDECVASVFKRADENMYENKMRLKAEKPSA